MMGFPVHTNRAETYVSTLSFLYSNFIQCYCTTEHMFLQAQSVKYIVQSGLEFFSYSYIP